MMLYILQTLKKIPIGIFLCAIPDIKAITCVANVCFDLKQVQLKLDQWFQGFLEKLSIHFIGFYLR